MYDFPKKIVDQSLERYRYRVYRDDIHYIAVDAGTAMEAVTMSGIARPVKILRYSVLKEPVLSAGYLVDEQQAMDAVASQEAAQDNAQEESEGDVSEGEGE